MPLESTTAEELDPDAQTLATLQRLRQMLEESDPGTGTDSPAPGIPDPPIPHWRGTAGRDLAADRKYPLSTVTEPPAPRTEPKTAHRGRFVVIVGAATLAVFAASAYFAYRWAAETRPLPIADKPSDVGAPVATGTVGEPSSPTAAAPTGSTPAGVAASTVTAPTPASTVPPVRPGTAPAGDTSRPETAPASRSPAPTTDQRRGGPEARDSAAGVASVAPAPVPRPRTAEGFELQQPRVGPCTEAVAALGLCTREPAQGKD